MSIHVEPHRYEPLTRWEWLRGWQPPPLQGVCRGPATGSVVPLGLWFPARAVGDKSAPLPFERLAEVSRVRP